MPQAYSCLLKWILARDMGFYFIFLSSFSGFGEKKHECMWRTVEFSKFSIRSSGGLIKSISPYQWSTIHTMSLNFSMVTFCKLSVFKF